MKRYLALLRGVYVGGNNKVSMRELVAAMTEDGFTNVRSYINSGNVLFDSSSSKDLAKKVAASIKRHSGLDIDVVVIGADGWKKIVDDAPKTWGKQENWKHNILVMIPPGTTQEMLDEIGELRPEYESLKAGDGVLYQSVSLKFFGRARSGALAGKPVYKKMTVRNYNTAIKLAALLSKDEQ
jgi:uncharacterized protein (DUF1697 family)